MPIVMITWQLYASNFEHLTKWKGNGYGMYTDSHGEYRSIVFRLKGTDSLLQVFPLWDEDYEKLSYEDKFIYYDSRKTLRTASHYPEWYEKKLKNDPWASRFFTQDGTLEIYRIDLDIDSKEARSIKVYSYE